MEWLNYAHRDQKRESKGIRMWESEIVSEQEMKSIYLPLRLLTPTPSFLHFIYKKMGEHYKLLPFMMLSLLFSICALRNFENPALRIGEVKYADSNK